jgi:hypothetical protein
VAREVREAREADVRRAGLVSAAAALCCRVYCGARSGGESESQQLVVRPGGKVAAIVAAEPARVIVAFCGCRDVRELVGCANVGFTRPPGAGFRVNSAVWRRFVDARDDVRRLVRAADVDPASITFTGHSLGGAVAQLAALMLTAPGGSNSISFGAPRVGDADYAEAVRTHALTSSRGHTRVVLQHDIVPQIQLHNSLVHAGLELHIDDCTPSTARFPRSIVENHASMKYRVAVRGM